MASIPDQHAGIAYVDFLGMLSQKRGFRRYLEIGVNEGRLMSYIHADVAVGIDPHFVLSHNAAAHKKRTHLISASSDHFFDTPGSLDVLEGPPDFSFLDGYHTFDFLLRDFMNTEAISGRTSVIGMHDCLPLDEIMAERSFTTWQTRTLGTRFQGAWTGDVWKIIPILKQYRPDLKLQLIDCPPTGVVCVTNLDPSSTVLQKNYLKIVSQYIEMQNNLEEITKMYQDNAIVSSHAVLNDLDHSLFFAT